MDENLRWAIGLALGILAAIGGALKLVAVWLREQEKRTDRLEHTVFGVDGTNGLKSVVKDHVETLDLWNVEQAKRDKDFESFKRHQAREAENVANLVREMRDRRKDEER